MVSQSVCEAYGMVKGVELFNRHQEVTTLEYETNLLESVKTGCQYKRKLGLQQLVLDFFLSCEIMSLLRYFSSSTGNTTPAKKLTPKESAKVYESTKRKRSFIPEWNAKFPWVVFDPEINVMQCTLCIKHSKKTSESSDVFLSGTSNFRISTLERHQKSESHIKCQLKDKAEKQAPGTSEAEKAVHKLEKDVFKRLQNLFRTSHSIAKYGRPYRDYVWMCQLDLSKGVDIGHAYHRDKDCANFVHYISNNVLETLVSDVKAAPFISVICDGSTDSSVTEQELVYVRFSDKGAVRCEFLSCESVEKANAENIFSAISSSLGKNLELSESEIKDKLCGFGSDGAPVMTGRISGVAKRLSECYNNDLVLVHCAAHRLELGFKTLLESGTSYQKISQFLMDVYYFYHNSPLNRSCLRIACDALGIKFLVPTRVRGTRWIGHVCRALKNVRHILPALASHLQEISQSNSGASNKAQGTARGFFKLITAKKFILFAGFMQDLLNCLTRVSALLQTRHSGLADVHLIITELLENIEKMKTKDGPSLREAKLITHVGEFELHDSVHAFPKEEFEDARQGTLTSLSESIASKFKDATKDTIVAAMRIADFKTWPVQRDQLRDFGDDDIILLVERFGKSLKHAELVEAEWTGLKLDIFRRFKTPLTETANWQDVHAGVGHLYPNALQLIDLLLSLPGHSADCERGFSLLKRVKNDWRNRLQSDHLTELMRVSLQTPDIGQFDPTRAIELWYSDGQKRRRPNMVPYGLRMNTNQSTPMAVETDSESDTESGNNSSP